MQTIMIIYDYQTQPAVSKFLSIYNNQIDKKYSIKLLYEPINLKRLITKYNPNIIYDILARKHPRFSVWGWMAV